MGGGERGVGKTPTGGDGLRGAIWPGMGEGKAEAAFATVIAGPGFDARVELPWGILREPSEMCVVIDRRNGQS